jgi:hypothetical protein
MYSIQLIGSKANKQGHSFPRSGYLGLKGQCHEIFEFIFFINQYPLGPFQIFSKILGDIPSSRCTTGH